MLLTCRLGSPNLSDTEKDVQHQLSCMGITEDMQRQEINQGVRSPIIATYRILLHRAMTRPDNKHNKSLKSIKDLSETEQFNTKLSPSPIVGKHQNFQSPKIPKSKACVLL